MVRTFVLLAIAMVFAQHTAAQRQLFLVGSYDFNGTTSANNYHQGGRVLSDYFQPPGGKRSSGSVPFDYYAGLHYRASRNFGIESGVHYSEYDFAVHDANYQARNSVGMLPDPDPSGHQGLFSNSGSFYAFQHYSGKYISVYYFAMPAYISVGLDWSHFPGANTGRQSSYVSPSGETLQMDVQFTRKFVSPFIETLWGCYLGNVLFTSYLKFYMAPKIFSVDYHDIQNGTTIASDHVTQNGDRIALGLRLGMGTRSRMPAELNRRFVRKGNRTSSKIKKHKFQKRKARATIKKKKQINRKKQTPVRDPDSVRDRGTK